MRTVSIENLERRKKATVVKVNDLALLAIILAAGAMIRFLLMSHHGYVIDISDFFLRWTKELQEKPFTNVYGGLDVDYPPFYLYILYIMGKVGDLLGIPLDTPSSFAVTTAQRFLMKYPALMADMGLGILTWFVARRHFRSTASLTAVVLVIFNPALIYNSAVWGQVDSLLCLFICWTLYLLVTRRFLAATVLYALALTFKPQVLFLLPVFGTALLLNSQYWKFILSLPIFTGVIYIVTKPFTMAWNPVTVISNYLEMIIGAEGKYKMLSMNMWNIWNVVGRAIPREITSQMEDGLKDTMPVIPIPGSEFAAALPSFHTVGIVLITLASLFTVIIMIRRRDEGSIFLAAAFIYLAVCLLGTRMHERYPLPAVMLLVFAGMYYRPVRPLYFLLTVLHLINLHYVLSGFLVSCQSKGLAYNPIKVFNDFAGSPFVMYLSTIFFFSSLLLMGVWLYHIAFRAEKVEEGYQETIPNGFILSLWGDITNNHDLKGILNRVAGRAGFLRGLLAQYVAPVKYNPRGLDWYEATFDLIVSPRRILQKREKSLDDESEPKPEVETTALDQWLSERGYKRLLSVYRKLEKWADKAWPYFSPVWTVFAVVWSYIRRVFNWIFSGFDNSLPLNRFTVGDFKILGFLFLCAFVLFFYNYTSPPYLYFDEEYFAKTAYQFARLERLYPNVGYPWETTHPHLGKLFQASMIKLFGFSPAAYRIPNLVFGVLSVLFLYLLGRDVLRSRRIGFFSAFFYMLCGLSLSQARLCTIDAPSAFFMILSFYCFYKYFSGAWHWLPSLSCTAVAIGLSIAAKWTSVFAMGMLVFLFSWRELAKVFAPVYAKSFFLKRWLCFWFSSRPFELARHEEFLLEPSNNGNCKPETDDKDGEVQGEVSEAMDNDDPAESLSGPAIESEDESEEQGEQAGGDDGDGQYDKAAEPPEGMPSGGPDYIQPRKSVFSLAGSVALLFVFLFAIPLYIYSVSFVRLIQTDKSQSTVRMYESSYDDTFPRRLLYFMFSPFDEHKDKSASTTEFAKWVVKGPRKADDMSDYKPPDLDNEIYISADQTKMLVFPTGVFALAVERSRDMYDYHSGVGKEENYKPHPFESRWFHWPLLLKVIWYDTWSSNYHKYEQRMVRGVVAIGNPILFWFGLPCILFLIWGAIEERRIGLLFVSVGFCFMFVPWVISPRQVTFLYHYLPAQPFLCMAIAYTMNDFWKERWTRILTIIFVIAVIQVFLYFYPWLNDLPLTENAFKNRVWGDWGVGY